MNIYNLSLKMSAEKGKRCERYRNNRMLKHAMSNNLTVPSKKKFIPKNKFKEKIFQKISIFQKYIIPHSGEVIMFRRK